MSIRSSSLFDLLPIGAYRSSLEGNIYQANQALLRLNGYTTEAEYQADAKVMGADSYVYPQRRDDFKRLMEQNGHVSDFVSETYRLKTGERIWVREHAHVVRDEEGKPQFYEGTIEDITKERLSLEKLQDSASLLRNVLQTIPDRVWLKSLDGVYLTCNDAFAAGLGVKAENITGTRDEEWVSPELARYFREGDQLAMQEGRPVATEEDMSNPLYPAQGIFEIVKTPLLNGVGEIIGILGVARSIQQRKDTEMQLRDISEQLELALIGADLGRWDHNLEHDKGYYIDERSCKMLGRDPRESAVGKPWGHLIHPDDLTLAIDAMRAHIHGNAPLYDAEFRARHSDGRWIWLSNRGKAVQFAQDGSATRMVGTMMDITARKEAEERLRATQADLQATLHALPDSLFELTLNGRYVMAHSHDNLGSTLTPEFLVGKTISQVLPEEAATVCLAALQEAHATGRSAGRQYSLELPKGKCWFELSVVRKTLQTGDEDRFIAIARDITEGKAAEEAIRHLAFHDGLTGLPNRRLFTDRLERALSHSARSGQHGALMFLDLDRFKDLNDTHGHDVGDLLLSEVARRLTQSVRGIDTVARLGGDEFVVLIQDLSADAHEAHLHASAVGHKILGTLNEPFTLGASDHSVTPSIGITLYLGDARLHHEVLKQADVAMYQAKSRGRNTLCFFESN